MAYGRVEQVRQSAGARVELPGERARAAVHILSICPGYAGRYRRLPAGVLALAEPPEEPDEVPGSSGVNAVSSW
jgi:hypothetical protein